MIVVFSLLILFSLRFRFFRFARVHKLVHKPAERVYAHRQRKVVLAAGRRLDHLLKVGDQIPVLDVQHVRVLPMRHTVLGDQVVLELAQRLLEHPVHLRRFLAVALHLADLLRDEVLH